MQEANTVSFTVYSPEGVKAFLCFPSQGPNDAIDTVRQAIQSGWLPREPGVEPGEKKDQVGCVILKRWTGNDGKEKAALAFYGVWQGAWGTHKFCQVYLNSRADEEAFEAASGLRIANMPAYDGEGNITRNESRPHRCECKPRNVFFVVSKPNPRYEGPEDKQHSKWLFVRYEGGGAGGVGVTEPAKPSPVEQVRHWLSEFGAVSEQDKDTVIRFASGNTLTLLTLNKDRVTHAPYLAEQFEKAAAGYGKENVLRTAREDLANAHTAGAADDGDVPF